MRACAGFTADFVATLGTFPKRHVLLFFGKAGWRCTPRSIFYMLSFQHIFIIDCLIRHNGLPNDAYMQ
jgi:hypothetical protein